MANTALIQVRIDEDIKRKADALFADLGFDTPTAIRIFLNQSIRREGLPFEVAKPQEEDSRSIDERLSEALRKHNKRIKKVKLETNEQGHIIIDKDLHPDLYDWAVNG